MERSDTFLTGKGEHGVRVERSDTFLTLFLRSLTLADNLSLELGEGEVALTELARVVIRLYR